MTSLQWKSSNKRRKIATPSHGPPPPPSQEEDDDDGMPFPFPFKLPQLGGGGTLYTNANHIYFNNDIDDDTAFALNKELRSLENKLLHSALNFNVNAESVPIYLHITTNGGSIYSAFSIIDCMNGLRVPVYTVCDGFVASAGTLISISGKKRFIQPNAYMLLHQLSSGVWGKMAEIEDEFENLKKLMDHLIKHYVENTKITAKTLEKQLKHDVTWNVEECLKRGIIDAVYKH
jgi:ATP-dependent Clp protease protease subunit